MSCSSVCATAPLRSGSSSAVGAAQHRGKAGMQGGEGLFPNPRRGLPCWVDPRQRQAAAGAQRLGPPETHPATHLPTHPPHPTPLTCALHISKGGVAQVLCSPYQEAAQVGLGDAACSANMGQSGSGVQEGRGPGTAAAGACTCTPRSSAPASVPVWLPPTSLATTRVHVGSSTPRFPAPMGLMSAEEQSYLVR